MSNSLFKLDPRLAADTQPVVSLALCDVLMMNDARFGWLIMVPRHAELSEVTELSSEQQTRLWQEVDQATAALRACVPCDKINLGALGNIVRQLHVHIVARRVGDYAWPGSVWGSGAAQPYETAVATALCEALQHQLLALKL